VNSLKFPIAWITFAIKIKLRFASSVGGWSISSEIKEIQIDTVTGRFITRHDVIEFGSHNCGANEAAHDKGWQQHISFVFVVALRMFL
jgi:hypothetical protein